MQRFVLALCAMVMLSGCSAKQRPTPDQIRQFEPLVQAGAAELCAATLAKEVSPDTVATVRGALGAAAAAITTGKASDVNAALRDVGGLTDRQRRLIAAATASAVALVPPDVRDHIATEMTAAALGGCALGL